MQRKGKRKHWSNTWRLYKSGSKNQSSSSARWGRKTHSKKIIFICITKQANLVKSSSWQTLINWSNADTGAVYLLQSVWTERLCYHASRYFHHPPLNHRTKKKKKKNQEGRERWGSNSLDAFTCDSPDRGRFSIIKKFGYSSANLRHAIQAVWLSQHIDIDKASNNN